MAIAFRSSVRLHRQTLKFARKHHLHHGHANHPTIDDRLSNSQLEFCTLKFHFEFNSFENYVKIIFKKYQSDLLSLQTNFLRELLQVVIHKHAKELDEMDPIVRQKFFFVVSMFFFSFSFN